MNITLDRKERNTCRFGELECGDVFALEDESAFCIKVEEVKDADARSYNAADLYNGALYYLGSTARVVNMNNELTVWY